MKSRIVVATGAGVTALVLLVVAFVLHNQADYSKNYVTGQLTSHHITFTPAAGLDQAQKNVPCLMSNAGKALTTGKQAECYALYQIGLDLPLIDNGKGYAQDHYAAYLLQQKAAGALEKSPAAPATQALVKQSAVLSQKAEALFDGETMRGLLLSAFGFSLLGERAAQAALACFVASALFFAVMAAAALFATKNRRRSRSDTIAPFLAEPVARVPAHV